MVTTGDENGGDGREYVTEPARVKDVRSLVMDRGIV
jgi:hypothetical protein